MKDCLTIYLYTDNKWTRVIINSDILCTKKKMLSLIIEGCVVQTKFDIYVFVTITVSIPLLVDY